MVLPVQTWAWVSELVLSFPHWCWEVFSSRPIVHILLLCFQERTCRWHSEKQPKKYTCLWSDLMKASQCGSLLSAEHGNSALSPSEISAFLLKLTVCE